MTRHEAIEELKDDMAILGKTKCTEFFMAIKALEQEPCKDCISRQAVCNIVDAIRDCISVEGYWAILERLKKLPSVNPQKPKTEFLDKLRAEIEKVVWEDVIVSPDGLDEVRIPCLDPDDVFEILDKYKAESEDKE